MRATALLSLLLCLPATAATPAAGAAATPPASPANTITLDTVTVSGVLPGPGLWKVSKGEHVLWILGNLSPLPKRMQWESLQVERVLARSQELLLPPGLSMDADIGFFGGLMLLPKAFGARKIPDDGELQTVLPADTYARWTTLKAKYLGRNQGIERWRPLFAANELYDAALDHSGLSGSSNVLQTLRKQAKKQDLTITSPTVRTTIKNPKAALEQFADSNLDDHRCFEQTLTRLETDLGRMRTRANAWAVGDIETLRELPYEDQNGSCLQAVLDSQLSRELGITDIRQRIAKQWLDAAEAALANNPSTLAVLNVAELLKPDGYLATLQARGYQVEAPR